jgi:hypothetical protein
MSSRTAAITQIATVTSHEIFDSGTPLFCLRAVAEPALTPELALSYLDELSTDIRGAVLLDAQGKLAAHSPEHVEDEQLRTLTLELFQRADGASPEGPVPQLEVDTPGGSVYAVRDAGWTLLVVTGRFAMPSVMFYDLRSVLADLGRRAA